MGPDFSTFLAEHQHLTIAAIILFGALSIVEFLRARKASHALSPTDAVQKINREQASIIDLRNAAAFKQGHIIAAVNTPANELVSNTKKLARFKTKPCILVCATGNDSQKTAADLQKNGYNAFALAGGMRAWQAANMPTVKDE